MVQVQQGWAKNEEPPPYKNRLPEFVCEVLETVFRWLNDEATLERCSDGITQIPSKSLDTMMREQVKKSHVFLGLMFSHTALSLTRLFSMLLSDNDKFGITVFILKYLLW